MSSTECFFLQGMERSRRPLLQWLTAVVAMTVLGTNVVETSVENNIPVGELLSSLFVKLVVFQWEEIHFWVMMWYLDHNCFCCAPSALSVSVCSECLFSLLTVHPLPISKKRTWSERLCKPFLMVTAPPVLLNWWLRAASSLWTRLTE